MRQKNQGLSHVLHLPGQNLDLVQSHRSGAGQNQGVPEKSPGQNQVQDPNLDQDLVPALNQDPDQNLEIAEPAPDPSLDPGQSLVQNQDPYLGLLADQDPNQVPDPDPVQVPGPGLVVELQERVDQDLGKIFCKKSTY